MGEKYYLNMHITRAELLLAKENGFGLIYPNPSRSEIWECK
jgi:hypothetical protein